MLKQNSLFIGLLLSLICSSISGRTLQQTLNYGTLRVGVALHMPWAMQKRSGELMGFEIDIANKLAEDMKVNVEFRVYESERLIPALESGDIDLIIARLAISPSRALHVNFSQPYMTDEITLATNLLSTTLAETLEDLNHPDYTIAAVSGHSTEELIAHIFPRSQHQLYEGSELASNALIDGAVDAYLEEEPIPTFLSLENPTQVGAPIIDPLVQTSIAFAVNKGDPDFIVFLNAWIIAHQSDTWLNTVHDYWFESIRWKEQLNDINQAPQIN
jgi:polar amino acid transport system substrate-binding protein